MKNLKEYLNRKRALLRSSTSWTTTEAAVRNGKIEEITDILNFIENETR